MTLGMKINIKNMITEINITDNTRIGRHYVRDLRTFQNGVSYKFKPGINVIIGKNGCGKSTLLGLIYEYTLCSRTIVSEVPKNLLSLNDLYDMDGKLYGGIKIHHDYKGGVFRYLPKGELRKFGDETVMENIENMSIFMSKCSTGESILECLGMLFKKMFSGNTYRFPLKELKSKSKELNDYWREKIENLIEYYEKNNVNLSPGEHEYTVLMDEPDRNLDIQNVQEIYQILSYHKPETQVIAVIHNPLLIYKLSKIPETVNIIEMTPGYLQEIIDFMENTL